ncbi:helix-turn-helix domain-containing protein [Methylobacterium goesingense]|uniref:Helix-turn-helix domain-containing protein n=1 Tax=Methylobacterium goesingense TaxID=243690 RepID=A0ABV2L9S4_9HYPH|nr:helix-turn-helix domain-containing protein [Methylobacterium goesingense]GJD74121.1 hypothetical protein CFIICLFH_2354 [Methylobacterium goesingense]
MQQTLSDPLITISAAAARLGINRSTLSRQIKTGAVRAYGQKVRFSEVLADRAANIDLTRSGRRDGVTEVEAEARASRVASPPDATVDATADPEDEALLDYVIVDGQAMPFAKARALKETYLARLRKLEFDEKAGALVDRAAAEKLFFDTAREYRDAWQSWPARIAIMMADELKVDARALTTVLNAHVRQHLAEMGKPEAGPLQSGAQSR